MLLLWLLLLKLVVGVLVKGGAFEVGMGSSLGLGFGSKLGQSSRLALLEGGGTRSYRARMRKLTHYILTVFLAADLLLMLSFILRC